MRNTSTKRKDTNNLQTSCTTHHDTPTQHSMSWRSDVPPPCLGGGVTRVGSRSGLPRYTRADFGQEAVGGSTTTTRARKQHATRDTQCAHPVCRSP